MNKINKLLNESIRLLEDDANNKHFPNGWTIFTEGNGLDGLVELCHDAKDYIYYGYREDTKGITVESSNGFLREVATLEDAVKVFESKFSISIPNDVLRAFYAVCQSLSKN